MTPEENKALVRRFVAEVVNGARLDAVHEFVDRGYVDHNGGSIVGPEAVRRHLQALRITFPDFALTIEDMVAEGDRVVWRVTGRGTHRGAWMGIPPTGRPITVRGINIDRIAGGKLVEHWGEADTAGMLQQMGRPLFPRS
jgi:predicted ester cyclase